MNATAAGAEIRHEHGTETREFEIVASPLGDHRGRHAGQLLLLRDITARKRAERQLRWLADYDQLTGLPNRRLLVDRLDQAIARARRAHGRCALLLVDLDRFKLINDSLGHQLGDQVLARAGSRLRAGRREEDTAARMGGDEFALVLPELATPADADLVARRVLSSLAEPMLFGDRELIVTASAGVAVWPDDGSSQQQLFSCADAALYRAKEHGRNRAESGATPSDETATERLELGVELYHAVRRGSCGWTSSRWSTCRRAWSSRWRRCCAGSIRSGGRCRPPPSCRWQRRPACPPRSTAGCWPRPAARQRDGREPGGSCRSR